jgi:hypothetical protein
MWRCHTARFVLFARTANDDFDRVVGQRTLQRLRFVPRRAIHISRSSSVARITFMVFGWIGSTTAFGNVV